MKTILTLRRFFAAMAGIPAVLFGTTTVPRSFSEWLNDPGMFAGFLIFSAIIGLSCYVWRKAPDEPRKTALVKFWSSAALFAVVLGLGVAVVVLMLTPPIPPLPTR